MSQQIKELIQAGKTALGIEFGSTRIKGVLIDYDGNVLATGGHEWENRLENGVWTYHLEDVDAGLRSCYSSLRRDVEEKYGITPVTYGAIGISAMMHGYVALDSEDRQIAPFQTWRNTNTEKAADRSAGLRPTCIRECWITRIMCRRWPRCSHWRPTCITSCPEKK